MFGKLCSKTFIFSSVPNNRMDVRLSFVYTLEYLLPLLKAKL